MIINILLLTRLLGIAAFLSVLATFLIGLTRKKFKYHRKMAMTSMVFALIHAAAVLLFL